MVNYKNGKIYKIECGITGMVYIGSTTKETVAQRLSEHVSKYKRWLRLEKAATNYSSFEIIKNGNYKIYLIELFPCNSKDELTSREGELIRQFKLDLTCVNNNVAGRTKHEYEIENKSKRSEKSKEYRILNKDKIEALRIRNNDKMVKYRSDYYAENKDKIKEKKAEKESCLCGSCYTKHTRSRHIKTQKHINFTNAQ